MGFAAFRTRMEQAELPALAIEVFARQYALLAAGERGLIHEEALHPVGELPDLELLPAELTQLGLAALERCVMIKLNGGLGTSMGLERAKSLLEVKDGLTFLDVIVRHAATSGVLLVLMNSFSTQADSSAALAALANVDQETNGPLDFLQHRVPKVSISDLEPAEWPVNSSLEWNPPGHGDLYVALQTSGMLDALLEQGRDLAFVSNADNLGAAIDPRLVGYLATEGMPFLMEVADRTEADRKGGHLARSAGGSFLLREAAQCPAEDNATFQDIERHPYFNTNNVWLDLRALREALVERAGVLELPLIRNEKPIDPRQPDSPRVYQLETAMGSAVGLLEGAAALRVPRSRFAPVKTTDDLLAVRSDANVLTQDFRITPAPSRAGRPVVVELDRRYFARADQLDERFAAGPPSLIECERLVVEGDVSFGAGIRVVGDVALRHEGEAPLTVADGTLLSG